MLFSSHALMLSHEKPAEQFGDTLCSERRGTVGGPTPRPSANPDTDSVSCDVPDPTQLADQQSLADGSVWKGSGSDGDDSPKACDASLGSHSPSIFALHAGSQEKEERPRRLGERVDRRTPWNLEFWTGTQQSNPLTVAVFVLVLLVVIASLFNILFGTVEDEVLSLQLQTAVDGRGTFGRPLAPFRVYIADEDNAPVAGVRVAAGAVHLDWSPIRVPVNFDSYIDRYVSCYDFLMGDSGFLAQVSCR